MRPFIIYINLTFLFLFTAVSFSQKVDLSIEDEFLRSGQYEKAIERLKKEIEKNPESPKLHYNLGMVYGLKEKHEDALKAFEEALSLYSEEKDKVKCWESMGWEYYLLGRYKKSVKFIQKALDADSTQTDLRFNLGLAKLAKRDFEDALRAYRKALEDNESSNFFEEAIKDLFLLSAEREELPEAHFILATIFLFQNLDYAAFSQLKTYLDKSPDGLWRGPASEKCDSLEFFLNKKGLNSTVILNSYFISVKDSTREKALGYWNEKERERLAGEEDIFDLRTRWITNSESLGYDELKNVFRDNIVAWYPFRFDERKDYLEMELKVIDKRYQLYSLIYYLMEENGRMVLCNPYLVLSREWERISSSHFDFFIKPNQRILDRKIDEAEELYDSLCHLFGVSFKNPVEVYVCSTGNEVSELSHLGRFGGVSFPPGEQIFMTGPVVNALTHEFVHIVHYKFIGRFSGPLLTEGLAVCYGGCGDISEQASLSRVRQLLLTSEIPSLNTLLANRARLHPNDFYPICGSFVKFLADSYGTQKLKLLLEESHPQVSDWDSVFLKIYGLKVLDLEKNWHSYIMNLTLPEIEPGVNEKAKEIFSYADQEGDDFGDGTYAYPDSILFQPGVCDILDFRVSEYLDRYSFKVKMKELLGDDSLSEFGFYGPALTIFIAEKGKYRPPFYYDLLKEKGLSLDEDYSYAVLNCSGNGVKLWKGGEVCASLGRSVFEGSLADFDQNSIQFSVPKSLLTDFEKDLRFGLICGCQKEVSKKQDVGVKYTVVKNLEDFKLKREATDKKPSLIYDMLVPEGKDQKEILKDCDAGKGKYVILPLIGK
ncbi:MAG: hypothetical protein AMJ90_06050 [candidate division Zixibacteria bacterium SM23_73_2]|nr:MAG: hypothetical protein AMJ90_06050 [candidate division Zixibacteria bacterium SM23_73_2]